MITKLTMRKLLKETDFGLERDLIVPSLWLGMLSSLIALAPSLNGPAALGSARTQRVATPVMQYRDHSREPILPPGWGHDFKQERGGVDYRQGKAGSQARDSGRTQGVAAQLSQRGGSRSGMDRRFMGGVMPTGAVELVGRAPTRSPIGGAAPPPGFMGGPPLPGFGAPTMTETEVARLTQEVEEAEGVLALLLQEMNAEKAKFKEEELHSDVTSDRYNSILTAHMQQWQNHKMDYDEAHRIVAGKKREAELAASCWRPSRAPAPSRPTRRRPRRSCARPTRNARRR